MKRKITISLAQIDVQLGDPEANFRRVKEMAARAASRNSDLVLFPELWSTGYDLENHARHAVRLGEGMFTRLEDLAKETHLFLGGSLLEKKGRKAFNTFVLISPGEGVVAVYRKIHLFRLMDEDRWLAPGNRLVCVDMPWGKTGLAICYDLRFPEVFREYALEGARITLLVAEWPENRIDHWKILLRARAIENQMFIAAVNRVGASKSEAFGGRSVILSPSGEVLVEGGVSETLLTAEIDLSRVDQIRSHIPVLQDRRGDVYGR